MDCDDFEKTLKVIIVGNGNVGKTSMATRYAKGRYTGNYKKTIGVDFMEKTVELRDLGETVNLMLWDTAGQEEFDTLTSRYYKGAGAVIYVFSTVDRASFDDLPKWQRKVEEECGRICHVLVQNKIDLIDDAAMSRSEVEDMADYLNIRLFRSCVQDNVNVNEVFEYLCRQYIKYGPEGGSDEALQAVADISTLSEATKRARRDSSEKSFRRDRRSSSEASEEREPSIVENSDFSPASSPVERSRPSQRSYERNSERMPPAPPVSVHKGRQEYVDSDAEEDEYQASNRHDQRERNTHQDDSPRGRNMEDHRDDELRNDQLDRVRKDELSCTLTPSPHPSSAQILGAPRATELPAKVQPSKRRTNGKKRHSVPDCCIS